IRSYFKEGFEESGTIDYFYTRDHLGSVREVVGSDGTTIASRVSYDPWGKITETGSGALTDFAFTGHHFDRPTGLGLTWWRGYDPKLGRWLSRDPIGLAGGPNLYAYVGSDPVNAIDPFGLYDQKACLVFGLEAILGGTIIWAAPGWWKLVGVPFVLQGGAGLILGGACWPDPSPAPGSCK
ncbi:MAG: hypothetical protein KF894_34775, partial [Labilithrix sp.]|nr:hypothetical protein [Labilithrix sp.]